MSKPGSKNDTQDRGLFWARRTAEAILRVEDLEALSRELGVLAATLSGWRDASLDGGTATMKSRPADDRDRAAGPAPVQGRPAAGQAREDDSCPRHQSDPAFNP